MQKYKIWAGTFLLVILGACASPTPPAPAPLQSGVHTQPQAGSTAATVVEITAPVWVASLSDAVNASPLVSGDLVIVPTADGIIHAVKAETGEIAWVYSGEAKVWDASVNADETKVCAGLEDRKVICLDVKTGIPLWTASLEFEVQSRIALTSDRVFAPTTLVGPGLPKDYGGRASLYSLDAANGNIVWETVTDNYILRRPVVNGATVISGGAYQLEGQPAGNAVSRIYALNIADGSVQWKFESDDGLVRWLESSGDVVTFSAATETIFALDINSGELLWQYGPGYWMQFPVIKDEIIYFGSGDENFQAYELINGKRIWQHAINLSSLNQVGRPSIQNGRVWFNAVTGEIYALDLSTGQQVEYFLTGKATRVGGVLTNSFYILGDPDGKLYAFEIQ